MNVPKISIATVSEIRLTARHRGDNVLIEVSDNGPGFTAADIRPGHGLDNVQRRLVVLFGPSGTLEISRSDGFTSVSLTLPSKGVRAVKAYLVDDELPALKRLKRLVEVTGRIEVAGNTTNPLEAIDAISTHPPDVLFLDIQMPEINGFELLARLERQPVVIFTTAYDHYALRAFEVNSIDYLLKPVEPEQLDRALNKLEQFRNTRPEWLDRPDLRAVLQELSQTLRHPETSRLDRIPVQAGDRTRFLELSRITHFFSQDRLTYAAADGKTWSIGYTIADLEQRLGSSKFVRIHRGALLNIDWLDELTPFFTGRLVVRLKDEKRTELTVARDRVRALKERLGL